MHKKYVRNTEKKRIGSYALDTVKMRNIYQFLNWLNYEYN